MELAGRRVEGGEPAWRWVRRRVRRGLEIVIGGEAASVSPLACYERDPVKVLASGGLEADPSAGASTRCAYRSSSEACVRLPSTSRKLTHILARSCAVIFHIDAAGDPGSSGAAAGTSGSCGVAAGASDAAGAFGPLGGAGSTRCTEQLLE